nr:uncharacterized protein LOC123760156 [Procambarus clarkii]
MYVFQRGQHRRVEVLVLYFVFCVLAFVHYTLNCGPACTVTNITLQEERVVIDMMLPEVSQEDPILLRYIRRSLLVPPFTQRYNLTNPGMVHFSQHNQSRYVDENVLRGMVSVIFHSNIFE